MSALARAVVICEITPTSEKSKVLAILMAPHPSVLPMKKKPVSVSNWERSGTMQTENSLSTTSR